jgi:hypothetical protein
MLSSPSLAPVVQFGFLCVFAERQRPPVVQFRQHCHRRAITFLSQQIDTQVVTAI